MEWYRVTMLGVTCWSWCWALSGPASSQMYLYASWPLEDSNGLIASAASIMAHIALNDAARAILRSEKPHRKWTRNQGGKAWYGTVYGGVVLTKIDELKSELEIGGYKVCVIAFNQQNHPITVLDRSVQHFPFPSWCERSKSYDSTPSHFHKRKSHTK